MSMHAKLLQSCLTLCDPLDCSPPGSSVHEILQARRLEWVAVPFSRGSSQPRDRSLLSLLCWQAGSSSLVTSGKPVYEYTTIYLFVLLLVVSELFSDFGYDTKADKNIHLSAFCAPNTHFCWEWNCYVIA